MVVKEFIAVLQTLDPALEVEPAYLNDYWSGSPGLFIDFHRSIEEIAALFGVETDVLKRPCPSSGCLAAPGRSVCRRQAGKHPTIGVVAGSHEDLESKHDLN